MIRRIIIASTFLFVLCSCASYDAGYRQGYADRSQRAASEGAYDGAVIDDGDYGDYDYVRNGYYGSYGYPYEFADYGFGSPWSFGFGFGPWFYQSWYGHGYPYGWHHWRHHHHGPGGLHVARINAVPAGNQQMRAAASVSVLGSADGGIAHSPPDPVRSGMPFHERGLNNEPREPHHLSNPRSHRSER